MFSNILDRISFWSLFSVIVLLPIFFLPFTKIPIETSKGLLLIIGLAVSIICWAAARFSDGKIVLPKSWILLSVFGIVLIFLLSALFSPVLKFSLFGIMLDIGSFYFILSCFLFMLMSSFLLKDSKNAKTIFFGLIISCLVVFVFQTLRLFFPDILTLGIFGEKTGNILGSWNSLGIFAGFATVLCFFAFEFLSVSKLLKWMLCVLALLSLLFITIVGFSTVWFILGSFALIIFVFKVSFSLNLDAKKRIFPFIPFVAVMLSLFFLTSGQFVMQFLSNKLEISNIEVSPSISSTLLIAQKSIAENPILGSGPNTFSEIWAMHKPAAINSTQFWSTSFDGGSGFLPTMAITTGTLGILSWLIFLALFFYTGFKLFLSLQKEKNRKIEIAMFFAMSLFMFLASIFYFTGPVIVLLAFIFLGAFIGLSSSSRSGGEIEISFLGDARKSFFSILFLVFIMIISIFACFKYIEKFISVSYFQKALSSQTIEKTESFINKATSLHLNDLYLRTYAKVYLLKLNSLANKGSLSDSDKKDLQLFFDKALNSAQMAISYNQKNYLNFEFLGSIYESVIPLGVSGAYDKAIEAYQKSLVLNPLNPGLKLDLARVSFVAEKLNEAKKYAKEAISLKSNYVDALVLLSQIFKKEGNNSQALSYAESALALSPQDKSLGDYVKSLKVSNSSNTQSNTPIDLKNKTQ